MSGEDVDKTFMTREDLRKPGEEKRRKVIVHRVTFQRPEEALVSHTIKEGDMATKVVRKIYDYTLQRMAEGERPDYVADMKEDEEVVKRILLKRFDANDSDDIETIRWLHKTREGLVYSAARLFVSPECRQVSRTHANIVLKARLAEGSGGVVEEYFELHDLPPYRGVPKTRVYRDHLFGEFSTEQRERLIAAGIVRHGTQDSDLVRVPYKVVPGKPWKLRDQDVVGLGGEIGQDVKLTYSVTAEYE
ncbi:MAG: hypothetical protein HYW25_00450 [Candidatus Aenigmarchaeota archaeon]|nr:hypothetical protein [Candidatus Aenigmarchaeota archaeon]